VLADVVKSFLTFAKMTGDQAYSETWAFKPLPRCLVPALRKA